MFIYWFLVSENLITSKNQQKPTKFNVNLLWEASNTSATDMPQTRSAVYNIEAWLDRQS
jgi:hypothetical protein